MLVSLQRSPCKPPRREALMQGAPFIGKFAKDRLGFKQFYNEINPSRRHDLPQTPQRTPQPMKSREMAIQGGQNQVSSSIVQTPGFKRFLISGILEETEKAYLIMLGNRKTLWFPKSQCTISKLQSGGKVIQVPLWLCISKQL
jgi:hypothetical protein